MNYLVKGIKILQTRFKYIRKINRLASQFVGAIREKLDSTISYKRMAFAGGLQNMFLKFGFQFLKVFLSHRQFSSFDINAGSECWEIESSVPSPWSFVWTVCHSRNVHYWNNVLCFTARAFKTYESFWIIRVVRISSSYFFRIPQDFDSSRRSPTRYLICDKCFRYLIPADLLPACDLSNSFKAPSSSIAICLILSFPMSSCHCC
jgi:hypothetical protein